MPETPLRYLHMDSPHVPSHAKRVFDGILFDLYQWEQKQYDGSIATYECALRQDSVSVIAFQDPDTIILTKQEQPNRAEPFFDVPGGRIEKGETPEEAARREFLEETGIRVGRLKPFKTIPLTGSTRFTLYYFIGTDLTPDAKTKNLDPGERIIVQPTSLRAAVEMSLRQEMRQAWIMISILSFVYDPEANKMLKDFLEATT
jgi:ADP-ribose pyrophosphatase